VEVQEELLTEVMVLELAVLVDLDYLIQLV